VREFTAAAVAPGIAAVQIKHEVDMDTGALYVDRVMATAVHCPFTCECSPRAPCDNGEPADSVLPIRRHRNQPEELQPERLLQVRHFFEPCKDLGPGKWVRIAGWGGPAEVSAEIMTGIAPHRQARPKPRI
jgi:inorganic pyrophosphatase